MHMNSVNSDIFFQHSVSIGQHVVYIDIAISHLFGKFPYRFICCQQIFVVSVDKHWLILPALCADGVKCHDKYFRIRKTLFDLLQDLFVISQHM